MSSKKKEFESIGIHKIKSDDMQVLRDNNITIASFVRTQIENKAKELRGKK